MNDDDVLLHELTGLDPAAGDTPPARGSNRYHSILETAMTPQTLTATAPSLVPPIRRGRRQAAGAVAAAVALLAGVGVFRPGSELSAAATVQRAADAMVSVDSLRAEVTRLDADGVVMDRAVAELSEGDMATFVAFGDGELQAGFAVIGDTVYEVVDGTVIPRPRGSNDFLAPFDDSSAAVVDRGLVGAQVDEVGSAEVRGLATDHYRITLADESRDALASLSPAELAWFELEYPDEVEALDVWIADDLVRRIRVVNLDGSVAVTEFWDLGEDITVLPPAAG